MNLNIGMGMNSSNFIFAILGYVCGSIPFGLLLSRWAGLGDIRTIGSGNIGATNVLRTGNKKIAALTLLCDGLKGYVPVLAASLYGTPEAMIAAGLGAFAGHLFPVWLNFKGGKGVATGLGVTFGWSWLLGLVFSVVWLAVFFVTRISSASALTAIAVVAVTAAVMSVPVVGWWPSLVVAIAVWVMHRANIARLLKGEEPKSSFSKKA
jgi:acyl phosphate:glycerol-3-phosphate acyltransferase